MDMIKEIEETFKNLLQKNIILRLDQQVYKRGKLLLYSHGSYNLLCTMQPMTKPKIEVLKIPLPFAFYIEKQSIVFDYRIDQFLNTELLASYYKKVKKPNLSKFYDKRLYWEINKS